MILENIVALLGLPRSGTTIIARCVGLHSRVALIIEPYHRRRHQNYLETDYQKLCADDGVEVPAAGSLLIKETYSRKENVEQPMLCLEQAAAQGVHAGLVLVLRSPVEAFLSQVEAVETFWKEKVDCNNSAESIDAFWRAAKRSLNIIRTRMFSFSRRLVLYDRFLCEPEQELVRMMGLFSYGLEAAQLAPDPIRWRKIASLGGDPKSADLRRGISAESKTDRRAQVSEFALKYQANANARLMMRIHRLLEELVKGEVYDDEEVANQFFLAVEQG